MISYIRWGHFLPEETENDRYANRLSEAWPSVNLTPLFSPVPGTVSPTLKRPFPSSTELHARLSSVYFSLIYSHLFGLLMTQAAHSPFGF